MFKMMRSLHLLFFISLFITLIAFGVAPVNGQSQALNGQIEGFVTDINGAVVPGAAIMIKNVETGAERNVVTDGSGGYRAPLLPLGKYVVTVEASNFKRLVREGITLTAGQTATVNLSLEPGDVSATVTITSDAPIVDPGKIDVGRVMNSVEVQNLPLVARNPYNFSLLQSNVTGRPNSEFGVPRINANGYARRTNYQLDGNTNTQADRAGIRLMPISETFVSEVQLVTNGFSAEFGNTPGLIMNAITPSGTNGFHGSTSYRFQRTAFASRAFNISPTATKPDTKVDNFTAAVGGPIIKDRWHFYTGYEWVKRDLSSQRVLAISETNKQQLIGLGVPASAFPVAIPASQKVNFFIVRTDAQLADQHRLTARLNYFKNNSPNNIGGGLNTLQRSVDFNDVSYAPAVQLISTFSPNLLNEFRFQFAKRDSQNPANANSATGLSIVISNVANFGAPENADTILPLETMTQILDNFTWTRGNHTIKFGGGFNKVDDTRRSNVFARYTFPSISSYANALNGTVPRGYTNFIQSFGDPNIKYNSVFYNWFVQDDWKVTQRLKINFGLRYDLYDIPNANPNAPFEQSRNFKVDKNNFAPRLGIVYGLRQGKYATILRASGGMYYEAPYLDVYLRALQNGGDTQRYYTVTFSPGNAAAPNFPGTLTTANASASIDAISPDFNNLYAIHTNFQLEQGLTEDISATFGFIHSSGRQIPVYRNINCIPVAAQGTLADGRPIYGTATVNPTSGAVSVSSCTSRVFPTFQNILMVESAGNSNYNAATFQLTKRLSRGYQFSLNYTLSRSTDDAPEQNLVAASSLAQSDPSNRNFDRGKSLADQTHTFVLSFVGRPKFNIENRALRYVLNDNQIGVIATANNGETYNVIANSDLNRDGVTGNDRPVGIPRNAFRTPKQTNVDLRYSRFFNITERFNIEAFGEFVNVFNINSVFQYNSTTLTANNVNTSLINPLTGDLRGPLPEFRRLSVSSLDSRLFQLGFKFKF